MKLIERIDKVKAFAFDKKNELTYFRERNLYKFINKEVIHTYSFENAMDIKYVYENTPLVTSISGNADSYMNDEVFSGILSGNPINDESVFISSGYDSSESFCKVNVYNIKDKKYLWQEFVSGRVYKKDGYIFMKKGNEFRKIGINGQIEWSISLSKYDWSDNSISSFTNESDKRKGTVFQVIGIKDFIMFLHISKCIIVAINVNNGEIIWKKHYFDEEDEQRIYIGNRYPKDWHFDKINNRLIYIFNNVVLQIDVTNQEIKILKNYNSLVYKENEQWSFKGATYDGNNNLYFKGNLGINSHPNSVGIFSLNNNEVVGSFKNENNGSFFYQNIKIGANLWAVLDNKWVLYIFEK